MLLLKVSIKRILTWKLKEENVSIINKCKRKYINSYNIMISNSSKKKNGNAKRLPAIMEIPK